MSEFREELDRCANTASNLKNQVELSDKAITLEIQMVYFVTKTSRIVNKKIKNLEDST